MRDGDPNGGGEPGRRPRRRSGAWLAALLVAAAIGGAVAVSAPGAADLPGNASDGTVTTDATWGTAVEVADVRYATAGTVASVRIDLGRGAAASGVSPDDVSAVDVVLYNDTEGVLAGVNGTAYDDQPTNVSVGRPVAGVDRIRIVATVATTAEGGDVIDAEYAVLDGDGNRRPWQSTAGRQPIVVESDSLLRLEVRDQSGAPIGGTSVRVVNDDSDTAALTVETAADGTAGPFPVPPGNYTAVVADDRFRSFATLVRLSSGESEAVFVTVERLAPPVPGQDVDGDGRNEDVDGDGQLTVVDVAVLLDRFDESAFRDNVARFDFNGDGSLNVLDVAALLRET